MELTTNMTLEEEARDRANLDCIDNDPSFTAKEFRSQNLRKRGAFRAPTVQILDEIYKETHCKSYTLLSSTSYPLFSAERNADGTWTNTTRVKRLEHEIATNKKELDRTIDKATTAGAKTLTQVYRAISKVKI